MKILIVNQHSRNHGDEAACLGLLRSLYKRGNYDLTVIYNDHESLWNKKCYINYKSVKQINPIKMNKHKWRVLKLYSFLPRSVVNFVLLVFKDFRNEYKLIKASDFVISAPGGPNLGKYKDQLYLWRLNIAFLLKKKYAIYSPSIGPFPNDDRKYTNNAFRMLRNATFLSLRDCQSYQFAEEAAIPYFKSIDTAYLESHKNLILPVEIEALLPKKYVVIVPHELNKWHQDYKVYDSYLFDKLYKTIIKKFIESNIKVVLLPQTFESFLDDEGYFLKLKSNNPKIIVIPTKYSSDLQQRIIELADYVVGARYHSIVFAINNKTPFYCLSYEHKMVNMLSLLNMESNSIDIKAALINPIDVANIIYNKYLTRNESDDLLDNANKKAKTLAADCFGNFINHFQ